MSHGTTLPIVAERAQSPNLTLLIPDRQTWIRTGKTKVGPGPSTHECPLSRQKHSRQRSLIGHCWCASTGRGECPDNCVGI
jgi:hypothetical protein